MIEKAKGGSLAARKLLAHIREHYGTIPRFCEARNADRLKVQKAINGDVKRIDVPFALDMERATDGFVIVADWATEAPPDEDDRDTCPDSPPGGAAA